MLLKTLDEKKKLLNDDGIVSYYKYISSKIEEYELNGQALTQEEIDLLNEYKYEKKQIQDFSPEVLQEDEKIKKNIIEKQLMDFIELKKTRDYTPEEVEKINELMEKWNQMNSPSNDTSLKEKNNKTL